MSWTQIVKWIKEQAKTIAVFVGASLANALYNLFTGGTPLPQTKDEWIQYAFTTVSAMVGAWLARNKITQKQLDKDPNVIGGTVVSDSQILPAPVVNPATASEYRNPWQ